MHCSWTQQRLAAYTEGDLSSLSRWAMRLHFRVCATCLNDVEMLDGARSPLRLLPTPEPPANLSTQLRAAMSIEFVRGGRWQRTINRWKLDIREGMRPMAIRTLGGSISAIMLFGAVMPGLWNSQVSANDDVPLTYLTKGLVSNPAIQTEGLNQFSEDTDVLVFIDTRGQMYDFQLLIEDQEQNARLRAEIAQSLLLAEFEPATFFGQPVLGRVVITFKTVKG